MGSVQVIKEVGGHQVSLPSDLWGIIERVTTGDPLYGWSGDPNMRVVFNQLREKYEILRRGSDGRDYLVMAAPPSEFDQRILTKLGQGDMWRRGNDPVGAVDSHNDALERDAAREAAAMEEEMFDILRYYANKDE